MTADVLVFSTDFNTVDARLDTIAPPKHSRYLLKNLEHEMQRVAEATVWSLTGSFRVDVEPGDETRYSLWVQRLGSTLVVARMAGNGSSASATGVVLLKLDASHLDADDLRPLANGNAWSAVVLAYACACLVRGLRRLSIDSDREWSKELRHAP